LGRRGGRGPRPAERTTCCSSARRGPGTAVPARSRARRFERPACGTEKILGRPSIDSGTRHPWPGEGGLTPDSCLALPAGGRPNQEPSRCRPEGRSGQPRTAPTRFEWIKKSVPVEGTWVDIRGHIAVRLDDVDGPLIRSSIQTSLCVFQFKVK